jgi:ribonuclease HI
VGTCSAFVAELWGVFKGLMYSRRMGFMHIELHVDSSMVAQVIKTDNILEKSACPRFGKEYSAIDRSRVGSPYLSCV